MNGTVLIDQYEVGQFIIDNEEDDSIAIIVSKHKQKADEFEISYDYNGNPLTVYDFNKDNTIDVSKSDYVIGVVYPKYDGIECLTNTQRYELLNKLNYKEYYFPISRISGNVNVKSNISDKINQISNALDNTPIQYESCGELITSKDKNIKYIFDKYELKYVFISDLVIGIDSE